MTETQEKKNNKKWIILTALITVVAMTVTGVLVYFLLNKDNNNKSIEKAPTVSKLPDNWTGASIILDNTDVNGNPLPVPVYDNSDPLDDNAVENVQPYSDEKAETLKIPIVGECEVEAGVIMAPDNYLTGCYYQSDRGGTVYSGHAVRGPRVGLFEKLAELPEGTEVQIDEVTYRISKKMTVPFNNLPSWLFDEGRLSLVTCQIDPHSDAGGEFTHNSIMVLEEA